MHRPGIPFHGEITTADATTAVEATIYEAGSLTPRTLAPYEYLEIDDITIVQAVAAETTVFVSDDAVVDGGETVAAGDFSASGGEQKSLKQPYVGGVGRTLRVVSSVAGNIKVTAQGRIRRKCRVGRPDWKEAVNGD